MIGLVLLLTYNSSGAEDNIWPAVFGFTNPLIITILVVFKIKVKWRKLGAVDRVCFFVGIASLIMWLILRDDKTLVQYALYVAIIADSFAIIPTVVFVWNNPKDDRPFAWVMYSVGYGLAVFAISDHTLANYVLPAYMFVGPFSVALILIIYRIKQGISIKEWI